MSCQTVSYAPPPVETTVEEVEVDMREFQGRPDAYAVVKGRLSSNAAQLVDTKQSREGQVIHLEVMEQTPRGADMAGDLTLLPPFQTRIPIELLGLLPGVYQLNANGVTTTFEVPEWVDPAQPQFADQTLASLP
ncbi:MAG: hypothetical protein AAF236_07250 [Verrucomicrobiota bacterium]